MMQRQGYLSGIFVLALMSALIVRADSVDYIHFRLGVKYKNEGKYDFAIDEFRKVLAAYPDNFNAYMHLAEIHKKQNNSRLVIYYLREALKYNPGWGRAHGMLASAYEQDGQYQRAIMELQQYVQSADPSQRDSIQGEIDRLIARVSGGEGAQRRVEEPVVAVVEEDSAEAEVAGLQGAEETVIAEKKEQADPKVEEHFQRVKRLYEEQMYDSAIIVIRSLLEIEPGHTGAYYYAGLIRRHNKQNRMARINFQRGLSYGGGGHNGHYHLGEILIEKENYSDAVKHLRAFVSVTDDQAKKKRAMELIEKHRVDASVVPATESLRAVDPQRYIPIEIRIDSLLSMKTVDTLTDVGQNLLGGIRLFKDGRFDDAILEFRKVLVENPNGPIAAHAIYNIGVCYYKLRLFSDAQDQFEQFLDRFANNEFAPKSMFLKTMSIQERSDYETAEKLWRQFIQKYRKHAWTALAYERLGDAYDHMAQERKAIDAYTSAINLGTNPSDKVTVNYKLGEVYSKLGNTTRAINSYNAAVTIGEENGVYLRVPDSYYKMADLHYQNRNFQQALSLYQRVTRKYPSFHETPWGIFQIGNIFRNLRQHENAIGKYKEVIEQFPDDYWARQAQWKLEDSIWEHEYRSVLDRAKRN